MHILSSLLTLLLLLPSLTLSTPITPSPADAQTPECTLPSPGQNCAGYPHADIIVQYGANATTAQRRLFLDAAKAAGARGVVGLGPVGGGEGGWGFTAFVPRDVVELMRAYGELVGTRVLENGCAGVPWCGEAPC